MDDWAHKDVMITLYSLPEACNHHSCLYGLFPDLSAIVRESGGIINESPVAHVYYCLKLNINFELAIFGNVLNVHCWKRAQSIMENAPVFSHCCLVFGWNCVFPRCGITATTDFPLKNDSFKLFMKASLKCHFEPRLQNNWNFMNNSWKTMFLFQIQHFHKSSQFGICVPILCVIIIITNAVKHEINRMNVQREF